HVFLLVYFFFFVFFFFQAEDGIRDFHVTGVQTCALPISPAVLRMTYAGASPAARVTGLDEFSGNTHYFIGNHPAEWRTNIPTYRSEERRVGKECRARWPR